MRRILLITFDYPPVEIMGSQRPRALAKYLPRLGWEVLVLTPKVPQGPRQSESIIETDYRDVLAEWKRRMGLDGERGLHEQLHLPESSQPRSNRVHTQILNLLKHLLTYPDPTKGWIGPAVDAVEHLRKRTHIDAIVTTSPPISCHLIGCHAQRVLNSPWIADFRDLWTQNLNAGFRRLQAGLEKKTLQHAAALVTVSGPWANRLQRRYWNKQVSAICNGFDPDDFSICPPPLTRELSISYTGQLYRGQRDPTVLFEVLRELIDDKVLSPGEIRVRFYGPLEPWLLPLIQLHRLEEVVELNGVIPRNEALQRQRESHVLLLLGWSDRREDGQHTGKVFEYLGARRPILAVGGAPGVLTQLLEETRAGEHVLSKEQLRRSMLKIHAEYKSCGSVSYHGESCAIARYSHLEMARAFARLLTGVVEATTSEGLSPTCYPRSDTAQEARLRSDEACSPVWIPESQRQVGRTVKTITNTDGRAD